MQKVDESLGRDQSGTFGPARAKEGSGAGLSFSGSQKSHAFDPRSQSSEASGAK